MEVIINEANLKNEDINEFSSKARAILIDANNRILIANYGGVFLLPGGKVDEGETPREGVARELSEELGKEYDIAELDFFVTLNHYQKDYPKREGEIHNRLVQTHVFIGPYKGTNQETRKLTEKEKKADFRLEIVLLDDLESMIINNANNNPRNIFFQTELLTILSYYKQKFLNSPSKKLELK